MNFYNIEVTRGDMLTVVTGTDGMARTYTCVIGLDSVIYVTPGGEHVPIVQHLGLTTEQAIAHPGLAEFHEWADAGEWMGTQR